METIDETEPLQEHDSNNGSSSSNNNLQQHRHSNQNTTCANKEKQSPSSLLFRCVIYGRSFRATYASLHVVHLKNNDDNSCCCCAINNTEAAYMYDDSSSSNDNNKNKKKKNHADPDSDDADPILVRLQFTSFIASERSALRSFCKRFFKQGDLLDLYDGEWRGIMQQQQLLLNNNNKRATLADSTAWTSPRFIVHLASIDNAKQVLQVRQKQYWSIQTCQAWHQAYLVSSSWSRKKTNDHDDDVDDTDDNVSLNNKIQRKTQNNNTITFYDNPSIPPIWTDHPKPSSSDDDHVDDSNDIAGHHGSKSNLSKRNQAKMVVHFLIRMMMHKIQQEQQQEQQQVQQQQQQQHDCSNASSSNNNNTNNTFDPSEWATASHIHCSITASTTTGGTTTTNNNNNDFYLYQAALQQLQRHGGVLDVAGGAGFVSMACGLAGIPCTVIDPRPNVGCLSKRERKAWKHAVMMRKMSNSCSSSSTTTTSRSSFRQTQQQQQQQQQENCLELSNNNSKMRTCVKLSNAAMVAMSANVVGNGSVDDDDNNDEILLYYCQPVAEFRAKRAWFGQPPANVDASVRHPDLEGELLPVVCGDDDDDDDDDNNSSSSRPKQQCSAIVALHPDEATDAIVDYAVAHQIPFLIVPCCVFWRLFPHRRKCNNNNVKEPVSTYDDLLEFLMSKHPSIQRTTLPFEGKNQILWSTF